MRVIYAAGKVPPVPDLCAAHQVTPPPGRPSACKEWDPAARQPGWAYDGPLCDTEIRHAHLAVTRLPSQYVDLEQQIPRALSQALDGQPPARPGPPAPIALAPEALQAEMVHVATTWEEILREVCRLSDPPAGRVRAGAALDRAVAVILPRLDRLARVEQRTVYPTGCEDEPAEVCGWEAVLALTDLSARARSMLGWTRRTERLPGDCSDCGAADLRRDEPRWEGDPCDVYCGQCARQWSRDEYDRYVRLLVWPGMVAA